MLTKKQHLMEFLWSTFSGLTNYWRPLHEKIVCHQARQKGARRGSLHGVNDRLSTFLTLYGGKIALVQKSLLAIIVN